MISQIPRRDLHPPLHLALLIIWKMEIMSPHSSRRDSKSKDEPLESQLLLKQRTPFIIIRDVDFVSSFTRATLEDNQSCR